ncbi:hypothetical protein ACQ4PT_063462 [Festuca glaucescens]
MDPFMAELFEMVVSGGDDSLDGGHNNNNLGTTSPEPVELDEDLFPRNEEELRPVADMTSDGNDNNSVNIRTTNNNMMPEGGDDSHVSIDMPPYQQAPARLPLHHVQLSKGIWTISVLTLVLDIRAALHKPARGVVFSHNQIAYYLLLSAIFASGLGEATTALWLSRPGGSRCRLSFGRAVLCASFIPFVAALSIAGFGPIPLTTCFLLKICFLCFCHTVPESCGGRALLANRSPGPWTRFSRTCPPEPRRLRLLLEHSLAVGSTTWSSPLPACSPSEPNPVEAAPLLARSLWGSAASSRAQRYRVDEQVRGPSRSATPFFSSETPIQSTTLLPVHLEKVYYV